MKHGFPCSEFCSILYVCGGGGDCYLWLELVYLQLSFVVHSPFTCLLDALAHCKQKNPSVSKQTPIVVKKAPDVSKEASKAIVSKEAQL